MIEKDKNETIDSIDVCIQNVISAGISSFEKVFLLSLSRFLFLFAYRNEA